MSIDKRDGQNTPTGLPSKLVVSSPETKRSLYTLPSRGRRLSPKTLASSAGTVTSNHRIVGIRAAFRASIRSRFPNGTASIVHFVLSRTEDLILAYFPLPKPHRERRSLSSPHPKNLRVPIAEIISHPFALIRVCKLLRPSSNSRVSSNCRSISPLHRRDHYTRCRVDLSRLRTCPFCLWPSEFHYPFRNF